MAEKADYYQQKNLNPGDKLRILLNSLEQRQSKFKSMNAAEALAMLNDLDTVYNRLDTLEAGGMALESERGRFQAIKGAVRKNMKQVLKAIGGSTALIEHRPEPAGSREITGIQYITVIRNRCNGNYGSFRIFPIRRQRGINGNRAVHTIIDNDCE